MIGIYYRPKTAETRQTYAIILTFIQSAIGDQPRNITCGAADEVLRVLKDNSIKEVTKKKEILSLLGDLGDDKYSVLVNLSKKITDWISESAVTEVEGEKYGINVQFEENEEEIDEVYGEVRESAVVLDDDVNMVATEGKGYTIHSTATKSGMDSHMIIDEESGFELNPRSIDAFWLQRNINKSIEDPVVAQQKSKEVMNALMTSQTDIELENHLVVQLGFGMFDFIKILRKYKDIILLCILHACDRNTDEMEETFSRLKGTSELKRILQILNDNMGEEDGGDVTISSNQKQSDKMDIDNAESGTSRNIIDIEHMVFQDGAHFMSNKKCDLPEGSYRKMKRGYEEVHVPASKAKPMGKNEKLKYITDLPGYAQAAFSSYKTLNRVQSQICETALTTDENILVSAPTGAGKTNVALLAIMREIGKHIDADTGIIRKSEFKMVYIAPMKSLVQEQVGMFRKRLESYDIGIEELTGDHQLTKEQIEASQIIVCTPEKWDIVTRKSGERAYTQLVRLIVIDEIHLLHDQRGPILECIVVRSIRQTEMTREPIRFVGLSATLPNYQDVSTFLRVNPSKGLFFFDNSFRPVPLEQTFIGIAEKKALKRFQIMNQIVYEKILENVGKHQILIFVHSRKETYKTAKAIRDLVIENDMLVMFLKEGSASTEILRTESELVKNKELRDLLPYSFAIHHAGMCRVDRTLVEDLFADKRIKILVSTATLAWGVNLPATTVIIKGTQIYSPEKGKWVELGALDVLQMFGRAGRPQYDVKGEGIMLTNHSELQYYLSLMNQQLPIESQFIAKLADNLNAEIVLGTIEDVHDAVKWLGYTYLYIRMLKAPTLYGIKVETIEKDPKLENFRYDLIHTAASILMKNRLIKYDRRNGKLKPTHLGKVASHFYITQESIATYNQLLKRTLTQIELFRVFSLSSEFKNITVREEEKMELSKLIEYVPIPIKEGCDEPSSKVNVLLQAYISQMKLNGLALAADMVYITQSAGRIIRALHEITRNNGWMQLSSICLSLAKMIERRMWSSMFPLRQFAKIPHEIIKQLEKKNLAWDTFLQLSHQEIGELLRMSKAGKTIHKYVHMIPKIELTAHVQPVTRSLLRIHLTLVADFAWDDKIHGKAVSFYINVTDVDSENILHSELFILSKRYHKDEHLLKFYIPVFEPMSPQYFITVNSDKWIGCETQLAISFQHLILPEKYPPPTDLLDLQALPTSALHNVEYEKLYSEDFSVYNPLQTQVFNTIYNGDDNVLIGGSIGNDINICGELAILRMFNNYSSQKCLYIHPRQSIVESRSRNLARKFQSIQKSVNFLSGDIPTDLKTLAKSDVIFSTPENWDVLSRRWKQRKHVQNIGCFIADNLNILSSMNTGATYEIVCARMRYMSIQLKKPMRIIALMLPTSNARDVAQWLGVPIKALFNFNPSVRHIPLEIKLLPYGITNYRARLNAMLRTVYNSIVVEKPKNINAFSQPNPDKMDIDSDHDAVKSSIVFVSSRSQCQSVAIDLLTMSVGEDLPDQFLHVKEEKLVPYLKNIQTESLKKLIVRGIGYIHEGLTRTEKNMIEQLFNNDAIQTIVVHRKSVYNINVKAHVVVIMDTKYFDDQSRMYDDYAVLDLLEMIGKASKPSVVGIECVAHVMCPEARRQFYNKVLLEPLPLESQLDKCLHDHFNAEIITRIIENKQDAVDYMTWTFLYRRISHNPNYYNLQGITHRHISDYLSELVEQTVSDLEQSKCIGLDNLILSPLNLGMIASFYYVCYSTIELFSMSLGPKTKIKGLIEILANATEFSDIECRMHEQDIVKKLAANSKYMKNIAFDNLDRSKKTQLLLYSHFDRINLTPELSTDLNSILYVILRLLNACVDVLSSNGWLASALAAMELSQMITQAQWVKDSYLKQIPHFDDVLIAQCDKQNIENVFSILEMENDDRVKLLNMPENELNDVAHFCNCYPSVEINFNVENESSIEVDENIVVNISLEREDELVNNVVAQFYPSKKNENWWLIIGDQDSNLLCSIKRVPLTHKSTVKMDFNAPEEPGKYNYTLYLMSDSYLGCDQEYQFTINVV
ncbi:hypothetical protein A3Q56_05891 [Intoshia linei]|uniref:U5 small nuclear ribonucleoprotein 200 kDa helicase n=1 Tax=Intoshia linei TaxID=1819745 RepID=A0A177AWM2_9BILA|nr:hypothetical protein A3Q56_05891 [Intoshia linei]